MKYYILLALVILGGFTSLADSNALVKQIIPPGTGDDTQVRIKIRNLSHTLAKKGADAAKKKAHIYALITGLNHNDNEVRAFMIRELQYIGGKESIAPLAAFLSDQRLCADATMALLAISKNTGKTEITSIIDKAFISANTATQVQLAKACGALRSQNQEVNNKLSKMATSKDWDIRQTGLRSLAQIANPQNTDLLRQAIANKNSYQRAVAIELNFLFARLIDKKSGAKICRDLIAGFTRQEDTPFFIDGLSSLLHIEGAAFADEIIPYLADPNPRIRTSLSRLLIERNDREINKKLMAKINSLDDTAKIQIIDILSKTDPNGLAPFILTYINSKNKELQSSAVNAAIELDTKTILPVLLKKLMAGSKEENKATKATINQLVFTDDAITIMLNQYEQAKTPEQKIELIDILSGRSILAASPIMLEAAASDDKNLHKAAMKGIKTTSSPESVPGLLKLLKATSDRMVGDLRYIRYGLADALRSDMSDKSIDAVLAILPSVSHRQKENLLLALAQSPSSKVLKVLEKEVSTEDENNQKAALKAIMTIYKESGIKSILKILPKLKDAQNVLACRGIIDMVSKTNQENTLRRNFLEEALKSATRDQEKALIAAAIKKY